MKPSPEHIIDSVMQVACAELRKHGYVMGPERLLPIISDALAKHSDVLSVVLVTPNGSAGEHSKKIIADAIQKKFGKQVDMLERADKSMIGGIAIQIDDERIDMSIRGALGTLEKELQKH